MPRPRPLMELRSPEGERILVPNGSYFTSSNSEGRHDRYRCENYQYPNTRQRFTHQYSPFGDLRDNDGPWTTQIYGRDGRVIATTTSWGSDYMQVFPQYGTTRRDSRWDALKYHSRSRDQSPDRYFSSERHSPSPRHYHSCYDHNCGHTGGSRSRAVSTRNHSPQRAAMLSQSSSSANRNASAQPAPNPTPQAGASSGQNTADNDRELERWVITNYLRGLRDRFSRQSDAEKPQ